MEYNKRLKELRERLGNTQEEISYLLDISQKTYNHYETKYDIIPIKHLNKLANYYKVSIDYILEFTDTKNYKGINNEIDKIKSGNRIKEFRKENKLTQSLLAKKLHASNTAISSYEIGRHTISTPYLYDLCSKYQISADYLLGKIDYDPKL